MTVDLEEIRGEVVVGAVVSLRRGSDRWVEVRVTDIVGVSGLSRELSSMTGVPVTPSPVFETEEQKLRWLFEFWTIPTETGSREPTLDELRAMYRRGQRMRWATYVHVDRNEGGVGMIVLPERYWAPEEEAS